MKMARIRSVLSCGIALLLGAVLAALRINILFTTFDPKTDLYPRDAMTSTFEVVLLVFCIASLLCGLLFMSKRSLYKINFSGIAMTFSHSFLGLCFLGLSFASFITSKIREVSLSRFDAVLVIFCLVCAVSFFMEAFGKEGQLGYDATTILMLFRPVTCLFISFYFYFDTTTVIHDSNKRLATLFFAVVLLTLLMTVKFRAATQRVSAFISLALTSIVCGVMYAVPNLVWFFSYGEGLVLSIFFDLLTVALVIWCCVCVLSVCRTHPVGIESLVSAISSEESADKETVGDRTESGSPSLMTGEEYARMISDKADVSELANNNRSDN